jgi:serine/threonine protein kinase
LSQLFQVQQALIAHARSEAECRRIRRQKTSVGQFETIKLIGKGAFGEVRLCRDLKNGDLVALKVRSPKALWQISNICHEM